MSATRSDALVLFGVTGDLAHKMIFPALYALEKRRALDVPIIGVASPKWTVQALCERVTDSLEKAGADDRAAYDRLLARLVYVSGDYKDRETFTRLKNALGTGLVLAIGLALSSSNSKVMPRKEQTSLHVIE